jgi:3-methylcrotonyl-CoA carboxylase alpha subunit
MFQKILVANRGEIACRIIKTIQSMGKHAVAVYSTVDKDSLHVQKANSAYCIGEAPSKDSYLNIDAIIAVALACGADAIHPGYGFLSENRAFAKACKKAHIVFIGPSVQAMEAMSSKQLAKQSLEHTNVPLTPGYHGTDQSDARLLKETNRIGLPVLIKAADGGGGKGMRAVYTESEFQNALDGARREARASFASDTMILEKLITNARHVEVQIMADHHGNVVHLFERDCSIQRRHQKIIEEAPAPSLPDKLRVKLQAAATEVARAIRYSNAGTVEFLVADNDTFYFMEMNTRLQVEHPVTELITGIDCVAWQIKIAEGNLLPCTQDEIHQKGHAIECRIYAEDPYHEFMPSIGKLTYLNEPSNQAIRIDTGIMVGSSITMYYDPMIAKLIAFGDTREEAVTHLIDALSHYYIGGIKTNIPFLQAICHKSSFKNATITTDFLKQEHIECVTPDLTKAILLAIAYDYQSLVYGCSDPLLKDTFAWQLYGVGHWTWRYQHEDQNIEANIRPTHQNGCQIILMKQEFCITTHSIKNNIEITLNGNKINAQVLNTKENITLFTQTGQTTIKRFSWDHLPQSTHTKKGQLTAPMPATVVAILRQIGDNVKAGERLIVLEAMKMEHTIHAPTDGILRDIFYSVGQQVSEGAELLSLEP